MRSLLAAIPISLFIGLIVFSSLACDPGHPVTYENRTDMAVEVFINGKFSASLEPMKKEKFELIEFDRATFEARDSTGRVIYSETFTWEELKEAGWRIVITEPTSHVLPTAIKTLISRGSHYLPDYRTRGLL